MPHRPPNGSNHDRVAPPRLAIERDYDPDPLAKPQFQILVETETGEYTILGTTDQPVELLRIETAGRHACTLQSENMLIVDKKTREVCERFENYRPEPQDPNEPITDRNAAIRDRWVGSIIKWVISGTLWDAEDNEDTQAKVKAELDAQGIEISISPGGCQVLITRQGATLAAWSAMQ